MTAAAARASDRARRFLFTRDPSSTKATPPISARYRRSLLALGAAAGLTVATATFTWSVARAQDAAGNAQTSAVEVENSKYQFLGKVNANAVYIRSGASDNDYPTMKLDKDAQVTVVGIKFDWLKILPPDGSFCYVAKAYVEKRNDGSVGRVTNTLNVRVGSALNAMKTKVAAKLEPGSDVQIIGEQDEYFKIKPPKDVYFYVNKQFVDPVARLAENPAANQPTAQPPANVPTDKPADTVAKNDATSEAAGQIAKLDSDQQQHGTDSSSPLLTETPSTQPSGPQTADAQPPSDSGSKSVASAGPTTAPTTGPSIADQVAAAEAEFDTLEGKLPDLDKTPLDQQPLDEMLADYQRLSTSGMLPESMRRMADFRIRQLNVRVKDKEQYLAVMKQQDDMRNRQLSLQAEREELEQRIKATGINYYTAVGTLRISSLQQGSGMLYRLTDPNTGRTLLYVRSNDPKMSPLVGQFIAVKGDVTDDRTIGLKVCTPTSFEPVDESKVNTNITAQYVPPSLNGPAAAAAAGAGGSQASTGNPNQ